MRSCSSSVLVDETAKQVTSVHPDPLMLADEGLIGGWIRRLQLKCSVRAMPVVVLDIDPKHLLQVASPDDQQPVQALDADRPNPTLRVGIRIGSLHRSQTVSTVKKSHATMPAACWRRNARQVVVARRGAGSSL